MIQFHNKEMSKDALFALACCIRKFGFYCEKDENREFKVKITYPNGYKQIRYELAATVHNNAYYEDNIDTLVELIRNTEKEGFAKFSTNFKGNNESLPLKLVKKPAASAEPPSPTPPSPTPPAQAHAPEKTYAAQAHEPEKTYAAQAQAQAQAAQAQAAQAQAQAPSAQEQVQDLKKALQEALEEEKKAKQAWEAQVREEDEKNLREAWAKTQVGLEETIERLEREAREKQKWACSLLREKNHAEKTLAEVSRHFEKQDQELKKQIDINEKLKKNLFDMNQALEQESGWDMV